MVSSLRKCAAAVMFAGACTAAQAAQPVDPPPSVTALGALPVGATVFSGTVLASGNFFNRLTFSLPVNGGSSFSLTNTPLSFGTFSFTLSFSSLGLYADADGDPATTFDNVLLSTGTITGGGNSAGLNTGPLASGTYFLDVKGSVPGAASGGLYSGAIAIAPIPEPEAYGLFLIGLGLIGTIAARRRKGA